MPGITMAATMIVMMVVMVRVSTMAAAATCHHDDGGGDHHDAKELSTIVHLSDKSKVILPGPKARPRRCRNPSRSER
jgi:hypothetical protein